MKQTLKTIALTTVVVLTLVGIVSSLFGKRVNNTFNAISSNLDGGSGGGQSEFYAEAPAAEAPLGAPSFGSGGGGDGSVLTNALDQTRSSIAANGERLVIKNADLAIVVKDPKADMARITKLAEEMGGFVVSSNLYQSTYGPNSIEVPEVTITIRVPSEKLDEALDSIKKGVVDVDYENKSGQDVTSEYVDLQSRLTAKQAAEKKLLEILDAANRTEDVLAVYTQLQIIQTDIEVLKGQIKYYEESAALSAISVRLIAEAGTQPIEVGPWKPTGAAKNAIQDLIYFFQNFAEFLIRFVLYNLPALILIGIPLFIVFLGGRAIFRRFNKSKAKVEVEEKEEVKK
jgi:uncharacterized protein DUF4349